MQKLRKYIFVLTLIFLNILCHASEIDSLKSLLKSCKDDSTRLSVLNFLVYNIMDTSISEAEKYFKQLESDISPFLNTVIGSKYYLNKGLLNYNRGNYDEAIASFIKGSRLADSLGLDELNFWNMNNIANVYGRIGNYKKSLEIQSEIIPVARNLSENRLTAVLVNMAGNFAFLDQPDSALLYFQKANQLVEKNSFYHAVILSNLAFLNNNMRRYEKALDYSMEALPLAEKLQRVDFLLECMTNVANSYYGLGDYTKSIEYSLKVKDIARKHGMRLQLANTYGNLAMAYESLGKLKDALRYTKLYESLHDSLFTEETNRQINELQIKYETEKKDRTIEMQRLLLKAKIREMTYISIAGAIILIISTVTVIFYIMRNRAYRNLVKRSVEMVRFEENCPDTKKLSANIGSRYISSHLSNAKKSELKDKLSELIDEKKLFLRHDLSLEKLARELEVNSKYVSQLINELFNMSFNDYLNSLRVKEVQRLLLKPDYEHFTLEAISRMAGFNSKSTFNKAFKKFVGLTPSLYREMSREMV